MITETQSHTLNSRIEHFLTLGTKLRQESLLLIEEIEMRCTRLRRISAESDALLEKAAKALKYIEEKKITVAGPADSEGGDW